MAGADIDSEAPPEGAHQHVSSRRGFLAGAAGLTGVAFGVAGWEPVFAAGPAGTALPVAADKRAFTAPKIGLELDKTLTGFVHEAEGGNAYSDVVNEKVGADHFSRKHLGALKWQDISLKVGTGMSKAFYDWIKSTFTPGNFQRHDGAVIAADFSLNELRRVSFSHALITEVGMPALDAASKDAARMTIKFSPEFTRASAKGGGKVGSTANLKQAKWLGSNFKLLIDGLDCTKVNKIEALVIKQKISENPVGENRDALQREPAEVDFPSLKLTLSESSAETWLKWHEDFVIKGNNNSESEKTGSLSYMAPDLKTELFRLDFFGLGIYKLDPDPWVDPPADAIRRVSAELYVEKMTFTYQGAINPTT